MVADPLARCKTSYQHLLGQNQVAIRYLNHLTGKYGCKLISSVDAVAQVTAAQKLSRDEVLTTVFQLLTPDRIANLPRDTNMSRLMDQVLRSTYTLLDRKGIPLARDIFTRECILRLWFDDFDEEGQGGGLIRGDVGAGNGSAEFFTWLRSRSRSRSRAELPQAVQKVLSTMLETLPGHTYRSTADGLRMVQRWLYTHKRLSAYTGSALTFLAILGTTGDATPSLVVLSLIGFFDAAFVVCRENDGTFDRTCLELFGEFLSIAIEMLTPSRT